MGRKEAGTPQHHHANQYHAEGSYPNAIIAIVINIAIIVIIITFIITMTSNICTAAPPLWKTQWPSF